MCLFVCECTCHDLHRNVRGQLVGVDCLFWLCGSQESSSGIQACRQVPVSVNPSHYPYLLTLLSISVISRAVLELVWLNQQSKHIHHPFTTLRWHWVHLKYCNPLCRLTPEFLIPPNGRSTLWGDTTPSLLPILLPCVLYPQFCSLHLWMCSSLYFP